MFTTVTSVAPLDGAECRKGWRRRLNLAPLLWMSPAILVLGIFYLYPVIDVFRLSFTDATLIGDHENCTFASVVNALASPRLLATLIFVGGRLLPRGSPRGSRVRLRAHA